jgi:hypothetical protein
LFLDAVGREGVGFSQYLLKESRVMSRKFTALMIALLILAIVPFGWGQTVWEGRIADGDDDIEEHVPAGNMDITSTDLEFPFEDAGPTDAQILGLRFLNVAVPKGAAIVNAYIEFECDETKDGSQPVSVIIQGELSADPAVFATGANNLSNRAVTSATAVWEPDNWTAADQKDQTSDISAVIEELVAQADWTGSGTIVILIRDNPDDPSSGLRCAEAYDGEAAAAPLLHIEWEVNTKAIAPSPAAGEVDVLRDTQLSWVSSLPRNTLYIGTSFDDVDTATANNPKGAAVYANLTDTTLDPGRLEFGTTYYWRVDSIGTAEGTVKGKIWDFTVELLSYMVPAADINAVASGQANPGSSPGKTIDGSGLADGLHGNGDADMWLSNMSAAADTFIQYEFSRPQLLQKMMVWNYNSSSESFVGWGIKDVTVEYTLDGETWSPFEQITMLTQAGGNPDYAAGDVFEFSPPVAASAVRILPQSNHGGLLAQYGLSEVQFYAYPTYAADLDPADGEILDLGNADAFTWRPGRNVDQHVVLLAADVNALVEVASGPDAQYDVLSANPSLGETYFWRVDEVNENETPSVYTGDVQSFSVLPYKVVDDFERYGNVSPYRPFQTWLDGYGYSADDYFPVAYAGNGTGVGVGHDIWSPSSPDFQGDIMETEIRISGSNKSMPVYYNNNSETTRTFASAQNWTLSDVKTLSLWFFGDTGNSPASLYVKLNNAKVQYDGVPGDLAQAGWHAWNIPLSAFNTNLQSVTKMSIGIEGSGSGVLYFDDVRLYAQAGEKITPSAPNNSALIGHWTLNGTLTDSSGKGNNGTAGGDPAGFVPGPSGAQALDFLFSYVSIDGVADDITDANTLTVSLWMKATTDEKGVILGTNDNASGHNLILGIDGGDLYIDDSGVKLFPPAVNDDQWHQVTFVRDHTQATLYVDGLIRGSYATTLSLEGETRWSLGQEWDDATASDMYTGQIGETRVYDYALSAGEVASLFGLTAPMHKPL